MSWYQDPIQFVLVVFAAAGFGYLGYRFVRQVLDAIL